MTTSRAMSAGFNDGLLKPTLLVLDEQSLVTTTSFIALLNLNPHAVVIAGDHKQAPPFQAKDYTQDCFLYSEQVNNSRVNLCPSMFYKATTKDSPSRRVLEGKMRMSTAYNSVFGKFFYPEVYGDADMSVLELPDLRVMFLEVEGGGVAKTHVENYANFVYNEEYVHTVIDVMENFTPTTFVDPDTGFVTNGNGILTPFLGQKLVYAPDASVAPGFAAMVADVSKDHKPGKSTACTFRPSQGMTFANVFIDFVKTTNFLAITNSDARVAFSRHKDYLMFSHMPRYDRSWFSRQFIYDDVGSIRQNYAEFLACINRNYGFNFCYDHHGDHVVKWRFFVWLLEYHFAVRHGIDKSTTTFGSLSKLRPVRGSGLADVLRQAGADKKKFEAAVEYLKVNPFTFVPPGVFTTVEWDNKFEAERRRIVIDSIEVVVCGLVTAGERNLTRLHEAVLDLGYEFTFGEFMQVFTHFKCHKDAVEPYVSPTFAALHSSCKLRGVPGILNKEFDLRQIKLDCVF